MKKDTKEISAIVTDVFFYKPEKTEGMFELYLGLQMFDGLNNSLKLSLDFIPKLLDKLDFFKDGKEYYFNLYHLRLQCLCKDKYQDTPLGKMHKGYEIIAIRSNIHEDWLDV